MSKLVVYVEDGCWSCQETPNIVADIARHFPDLKIELLDLKHNPKPNYVFATPTYVLDGRIIFLGNPTNKDLRRKLGAAWPIFNSIWLVNQSVQFVLYCDLMLGAMFLTVGRYVYLVKKQPKKTQNDWL